MAVSQTKDGRWFCYYRQDGKTKREYFGREPGAHGESLERDDEIRQLRAAGKPTKNHSPIFQEVAVAYQKAKFSKMAFVSCHNLYYKLKGVIFQELGHLPVMQISNSRLDSYVLKRLRIQRTTKKDEQARFIKRTTVHRELSDIRATSSIGRSSGGSSIAAPCTIMNSPSAMMRSSPSFPGRSPGDHHPCSTAPYQGNTPLYYVGLRPGAVELLGMIWDDVNWQDRTIMVRAAKKGGRPTRKVPWHPDLEAILQAWAKADNTGCIIKYQGGPVKSVRSAWDASKRRAGITRRLRMYDIRHAFVTTLLEEGADLQTVTELAGHNIDTMLKSYQHLTQRLRKKTITQLPGLGSTVLPESEK